MERIMKYLGLLLASIFLAGCNVEGLEVNYITDKIVFITNGTYTVSDIGSSYNVDDICQSEANLSELTSEKQFIAFSESGGLSYNQRAEVYDSAKKWINIDADSQTLRSFYIGDEMNINKDQFGNEIENPLAWSNLTFNGDLSNAPDCQSMTSLDSNIYARYYSNGNIDAGFTSCDTASLRFICVEL